MRAIIPGAVLGSSAVPPNRVCPLVTVSRLVPSLAIWASSPAEEEADRPSTATIAATPMAMPVADRAARSLRVRSPTLATRARSAGRSRPAEGRGGPAGGGGVLGSPPGGARGGGPAPSPPARRGGGGGGGVRVVSV